MFANGGSCGTTNATDLRTSELNTATPSWLYPVMVWRDKLGK